jgi:hypothetical protein
MNDCSDEDTLEHKRSVGQQIPRETGLNLVTVSEHHTKANSAHARRATNDFHRLRLASLQTPGPRNRPYHLLMPFRVLIIGGTGQVGAAVVRALMSLPSCAEVVMVNRKAMPLTGTDRLREVVLDTGAANFQAEVTKLAIPMPSMYIKPRLNCAAASPAANERHCFSAVT